MSDILQGTTAFTRIWIHSLHFHHSRFFFYIYSRKKIMKNFESFMSKYFRYRNFCSFYETKIHDISYSFSTIITFASRKEFSKFSARMKISLLGFAACLASNSLKVIATCRCAAARFTPIFYWSKKVLWYWIEKEGRSRSRSEEIVAQSNGMHYRASLNHTANCCSLPVKTLYKTVQIDDASDIEVTKVSRNE